MKNRSADINQIKEIVAKALSCSVDSLHSDSGLSRHEKWDSLGQIQIIVELEEVYRIKVDESNIECFTTIQKIYDYLNGDR